LKDLGGAVRVVAVDRLFQKIVHVYASLFFWLRALIALPHSSPLARALASRSRPNSRTATRGQPAATVPPIAATDDDHADGSAAAYSTVEAIAWVSIGLQDAAAHDARWIPIRSVAKALLG
jgi:hypothetical protein